MRYIKLLPPEEKKKLCEIYKNHEQRKVRERAHAIILSEEKKFSINMLSEIFNVDRDTISSWFNNWEMSKFEGLYDAPRAGRKRILSSVEESEAIKIIVENPVCLKSALEEIKKKFKKDLSSKTLKRCLKRNDYIWKRIRKSIKKTKPIPI